MNRGDHRGDGPGEPEESDRPHSGGRDLHGERRVRAPWRLLVMDRDRATCEAIARTLTRAPDFEVVGRALTAEEVLRKVKHGNVDFVLANVHLPGEEVLEVCRSLRDRKAGELPEVVITGTTTDPALVLRYLEAGAAGFTSEELSVEGLRVTLRLLARGESVFPLDLQYLLSARLSELAELLREGGLEPDALWTLTFREGEVLLLLEKGLTNLQIARRLHISEGTVKSHVHEILRKLEVRSRTEAVKVLNLHRSAPGRLVLDESGFRREP